MSFNYIRFFLLLLSLSLNVSSYPIKITNKSSETIRLDISKKSDKYFINLPPNTSSAFEVDEFTNISWGKVRPWDILKMAFKENPRLEGKPILILLNEEKGILYSSFSLSVQPLENDTNEDNEDEELVKVGFRNRWQDATDLRINALNKKSFKAFDAKENLKRSLIFTDNNSPLNPDTKRAVVIGIHGTFAKDSSAFMQTQNSTFRYIQEFCEEYATPVEYIAFGWSGENSDVARLQAGEALAELIDWLMESDNITRLATLSHSHGGNVVNVATHIIKQPIDDIINLFTPVRTALEVYTPKQDGFGKMYNFYSTGDHVQLAGALDRAGFAGGRKQIGRRIANLRVQYDGLSPPHTEKEPLIKDLIYALRYLNSNYKLNNDLDINFSTDNPDWTQRIQLVIRHPVIIQKLLEVEDVDEPKDASAIAIELAKEAEFSKTNAKIFKDKYHKDIGYKGFFRLGDFVNELASFLGMSQRETRQELAKP